MKIYMMKKAEIIAQGLFELSKVILLIAAWIAGINYAQKIWGTPWLLFIVIAFFIYASEKGKRLK